MEDIVENELLSISHVFDDVCKNILERKDKPEMPISSLKELDSYLWGLRKKELLVIGARTSMGKTSFALQLAWDMAEQGKKVYFLSLEMSKEALVERLFCNQMKVENTSLRKGQANPDELNEKASLFREKIKSAPLHISDSLGRNVKEITGIIQELEKPDIVIIDYLQAIAMRGVTLDNLNEYIRKFRELAVKHDFCAILVSQVNRAPMPDDKKPTLWTLKGTGVLEEHADTVLLLHWDYFYSNNEKKFNDYTIVIAKQKDGVTGTVNCCFYPEYYKFEDICEEA